MNSVGNPERIRGIEFGASLGLVQTISNEITQEEMLAMVKQE
jgi:hypothetical protein